MSRPNRIRFGYLLACALAWLVISPWASAVWVVGYLTGLAVEGIAIRAGRRIDASDHPFVPCPPTVPLESRDERCWAILDGWTWTLFDPVYCRRPASEHRPASAYPRVAP